MNALKLVHWAENTAGDDYTKAESQIPNIFTMHELSEASFIVYDL